MTWFNGEIKYEGFPLLLRKPDIKNIWEYQSYLTQLWSVVHLLDNVQPNGLPETDYHNTLSAFDHFMCNLFDNSTEGLIFLIETYAGKRNYYYYTQPGYDMNKNVNYAKEKFNVALESRTKEDADYGFLKKYPVKLF